MTIRLQSFAAVAAISTGVAATLIPVLSQVSSSPLDACFARKHALWTAYILYTQDYNGTAVPTNRYAALQRLPDVMHGQFLMPYHARYGYLRCPADPNAVDSVLQMSAFDGPPANDEERLYDFAMRADTGYNYAYFSPLACLSDGTCSGFGIQLSRVQRPPTTFLYLDSIWNRTTGGAPIGGGNWAVDPPCVRLADGTDTRPFPPGMSYYYWFAGWNPSRPLAWNQFGGTWPWHFTPTAVRAMRFQPSSRAAVIYFDGHAAALTTDQIAAGCDVRDGWAGRITDVTAYQWSTVY